jgi:hypothetical protein
VGFEVTPTFVLEEIAHSRPAGENKLGDIFDDFCFLLGRECGEPFGETLDFNCEPKVMCESMVGDENVQLCPAVRAESGSYKRTVSVNTS